MAFIINKFSRQIVFHFNKHSIFFTGNSNSISNSNGVKAFMIKNKFENVKQSSFYKNLNVFFYF